jgi:dienelactone hydrolase
MAIRSEKMVYPPEVLSGAWSTFNMKFDFDPAGWIHWPEREDLSLEFMRLLAAAQEGGSTVSECWSAVSRIDFADDCSWHREWTRTAEANDARAVATLAEGNIVTARSNWLRALNYYQAAACPLDLSEELQRAAIAAMRKCAANYLRYREPRGEIVSIPWLNGMTLQGYYLPARATEEPAPAVICIGEPGHRKEEYLSKVARHAFERGISLLAVDVLGTETGAQLETVLGCRKLESAIGHFMDYLSERDDVDAGRIAILADGWASSFVARGIAFDGRFAAAVCDGGLWDLHERSFLERRMARSGAEGLQGMEASRIARNIDCPVLVTVGERGWLKTERVTRLVDQLTTNRRDITLKIFKSGETAAAQGHMDNPTLANEFIFDWIAARLG